MTTTMQTKPTLRPYQAEGVEFLRRWDRAYLADEMGLGKTAQLVSASVGRTLVVAPATIVASGSWADEIETWSDDPSRFTIASYSSLTRRQKRINPETGRAGYTATTDLVDEVQGPWDTVILDEAHYIKNAKATRTKAIQKICRTAERVYMASGTPIPNWPHEIFVPLQILHPQDARGGGDLGSYWRWIDEWFKTVPNRYSDYAVDIIGLRGCGVDCSKDPLDPCQHYRRFTERAFRGRFLQRLRDEVLTDLPPLTIQQVQVPMTSEQGRQYRKMVKDYLATVDDQEIVAWSASAKNTLLDKMTTSLGMVGEGDPLRHSGKLDQLREDLEGRSRPTLVIAHYRSSVEACAKVARDLGLRVGVIHGGTPLADRGKAIRGFQRGEIDVLCGSLETVSEGLNLTVADMVIMVETSYKPSRNQQAIRRIHRIGQTRPCTVRDYIAISDTGRPTLDGRKRELLAEKIDSQTRTLTAAQFKELLK